MCMIRQQFVNSFDSGIVPMENMGINDDDDDYFINDNELHPKGLLAPRSS